MILSFLENIHEKTLRFDRMHENKTYFCIFWNCEEKKSSIFNIRSVFYTVIL